MKLPHYSEDEIKKIEEEFKDVPWMKREETEFKDVKFVSVHVDDLIQVRGHYRRINGKRVYIKPYLRRRARARK